MLSDVRVELGTDPGLEKDGVEAELQELIAARVEALKEGFRLIRREYPTDIGPVDLLCSDADGRTVVVEVKRIGEIAGVEQLLRYQERLDRDSRFAPTLGSSWPSGSSPRPGCSPRARASPASRSTSRPSATASTS